MDTLDREIMSSLRNNGRKPFTEIAASLGVSEGTVRKRFARLVNDQVLQIIGKVDPLHAGFDAPARIGVSFKPVKLESAIAHIIQLPEVTNLVLVSGEFDLLIDVICEDRQHLTNFLNQSLRKIPGVEKVQTHLVLHAYKIPNNGDTQHKFIK